MSGAPYGLTYDLDTVGPCDFDGTLEVGYTAHPKRDPATAELHAMSYFSARRQSRSFSAGTTVGEFVFVPSDDSDAEDEGVLMGYVYDGPRGASDLVVVDAESLETVASVLLPARVPNGFHGNWIRRSPRLVVR